MVLLFKFVSRILLILLLGGFLGATLVRLSPGYGVDQEELDFRLSQASIQSIRQADVASGGLLAFYARSVLRLLHGDLGYSRNLQEPVRQLLAERLPETLRSVALALALGWLAGLGLAIATVLSRGGVLSIAASLLASVILCMPAAVLALLFVNAQLPGRLVLALVVYPKIFHYARSLLSRSAALPHVLLARAKGAGSLRVLLCHVFPVAGPQLLALAGVSVSLAFAAAIPVEALCDLPGIGQLAWQAALGRDLVVLVNLTMIVTLVTVLANSAAELAARVSRGGAS
jgi:peptide/nickel transport system permease protein